KRSYGVVLYQEQGMRGAMQIAGFTAGQADLLRRAMAASAVSRRWRDSRRSSSPVVGSVAMRTG
ncbi:MAG: hypothetical protein M3008_13785, partial [Chloroflexota bacterium]|nr:hypothetical protein [Chloroflexota bacterium]